MNRSDYSTEIFEPTEANKSDPDYIDVCKRLGGEVVFRRARSGDPWRKDHEQADEKYGVAYWYWNGAEYGGVRLHRVSFGMEAVAPVLRSSLKVETAGGQ